jgi:hypothetical protein
MRLSFGSKFDRKLIVCDCLQVLQLGFCSEFTKVYRPFELFLVFKQAGSRNSVQGGHLLYFDFKL